MIGLVWGALQALFGIVTAVAAFPAIVEFIEFLVAKIGQGGFWDAVWAMLKAQWSAFSGLFTTVQDLDARARGEILGGALITVILLVIEILTGLAESGVALEFTAAGLLRVLKATGKMSLDAVKKNAEHLSENMAAMRRMGRGAMHALPHAVEGTAEFLRGKGLPPEFKAAIGKVGSHVTGEIGGHVVGIVKDDVQNVRNLRDLSAGVHMHLKGKFRPSESALLSDSNAARSPLRSVGRPGQPGSYGEGIRTQLIGAHEEVLAAQRDDAIATAQYKAVRHRVIGGQAAKSDLDRYFTRWNEAGARRTIAEETANKVRYEALAAPDPIKSIQINGKLGDSRDLAMSTAREFVARVTSRNVAPTNLRVGLAKAVSVEGQRFASSYLNGTVSLTPIAEADAAVHELGHWLEQLYGRRLLQGRFIAADQGFAALTSCQTNSLGLAFDRVPEVLRLMK